MAAPPEAVKKLEISAKPGLSEVDTIALDAELILKSHKEPHFTMWTLVWAALWTGVLLYGFVLLMR